MSSKRSNMHVKASRKAKKKARIGLNLSDVNEKKITKELFISFHFQRIGGTEIVSQGYSKDPTFFVSIHPFSKKNTQPPGPYNNYGTYNMDFTIKCQTDGPVNATISAGIIDRNSQSKNSTCWVLKESRSEAKSFEIDKVIDCSKYGFAQSGMFTFVLNITMYELNVFPLERKLRNLISNNEGTDCVIINNGDRFDVHKTVLVAGSDVFKAMLLGNMKEAETNEIIIDDIDPEVLIAFIEFLYGKKCCNEILNDYAEDLFVTAHKYNVNELISLCQVFLASKIDINTVSSVLAFADKFDNNELREKSIDFIAKNAAECVNKPDFFESLSLPLVQEVLKAVALAKK